MIYRLRRLLDITYASLAKSFNQLLTHHAETLARMREMYQSRSWTTNMEEEQKTATRRMALFPENAEVLFVGKDIWVVS
jgi:molybdopterin-biosynthesis enzyme MoeA-like protein